MVSLTVGSVPYINALPLISGLGPDIKVLLANPSDLPPLLETGEAQAIMVSSIECLRNAERKVVRGIGIASDGVAESVRLFSKVPFSDIKRLALDAASMTSNSLAQIWLQSTHKNKLETQILDPNLDEMFEWADAAILIGDNGIKAEGVGLYIQDLGLAWTEMTGLPFVWALWTGKLDLPFELAEKLRNSLTVGETKVAELSAQASLKTGLPPTTCLNYFTHVMRYRLDERFERGLNEFGQLLKQHGLIHEIFPPRWV